MSIYSNNKAHGACSSHGICGVIVAILCSSALIVALVGCLQNVPTEGDSVSADIFRKTSATTSSWNMADAKWGVGHHFLAGGTLDNANYGITKYDDWNKYINDFDVTRYADVAEKLGFGYVIFTIGQNRGYVATTSSVYDKNAPPCPSLSIAPGCKNQAGVAKADYTPTRDLILDLGKALKAKKIKLITYLPAHIPDRWTGKKLAPQYPDWWITDFITEKSKVWGTNVAGWWFDGYWPIMKAEKKNNKFPILTKIHKSVISGNSDARLTFNTGVGKDTSDPFSNYTAGEYNNLNFTASFTSGTVHGYGHTTQTPNKVQRMAYTFLSDPSKTKYNAGWGQIQRNLRYDSQRVAQVTKAIADVGGLVTWDVSINPNGTWPVEALVQVQIIGNTVGTSTDKTYSGLKLVNDNDPSITYSKGHWRIDANRDHGDYQYDVHYATVNGASVTYIFTGSSIVYVSPKNTGHGDVEVYIDGKSQGVFSTLDTTATSRYRQVQQIIFEKHDLSAGLHTLTLVKRSGIYMLVDALLSKK